MPNKTDQQSHGARPPARPRPKHRVVRRRRTGPPDMTPQRVLAVVIATFLFTLVLAGDLFRHGLDWSVGDTATQTIVADRTVTWVDDRATAQLVTAARDAAPRQYTPSNPENDALQEIHLLFGRIDVLSATGQRNEPGALEDLLANEAAHLSQAQAERLLALSDGDRAALRRAVTTVLAEVYRSQEIHDDTNQAADLRAAGEVAAEKLSAAVSDPADRTVAETLVISELRPNRLYDQAGTTKARDAAEKDVEPVRRTINRGETVVAEGEVVDEQALAKFQALGLILPGQDYRGLLGTAALVFVILVLLLAYIRMERPDIYFDLGKLALMGVLLIGAIAFFRAMMTMRADPASGLAHTGVFCGALIGLLINLLVDYRLAMTLTAVLGLFLGLMMPGAGLSVAFETWFAGRIAAMALRSVTTRRDLGRAAMIIGLGGMVIATVVDLPSSGTDTSWTWRGTLADAVAGLLWALMAFLVSQGLMPILERLFSVVTSFRLLELTNISSPALDLLRRHARGSFDSSLTIGDMASEACAAIGADALTAQVMGYYHDLGKVRHPKWFVENQEGQENIHDRLEPTVSAMAIKSHVAEGLELAEEYGLPQPVKDAIAQHHGTTMISFFYQQARERSGSGATISEEQFRYDGPKPQSKETAVLMLADVVEAAVRASARHGELNTRRIRDMVDRMITTRVNEGQLDEAPLTRRDLTRIADAFCDYLRGLYHSRTPYPTPETNNALPDHTVPLPTTPASDTTHAG